MDRVISFPHLGNYYIVFDYFIRKATKCKVIVPPATTKRTIEIGSKYAPSFVCVPFKYNLGNYIEALEKGANILVQGGGGCRYGYYGELEEKILRDLGYDFEFYNMISDNHISLKKGYKFCKKMNKRANPISTFYYLINSLVMIICMDKIEKYIRLNMGFEVVDGSFENVEETSSEEKVATGTTVNETTKEPETTKTESNNSGNKNNNDTGSTGGNTSSVDTSSGNDNYKILNNYETLGSRYDKYKNQRMGGEMG